MSETSTVTRVPIALEWWIDDHTRIDAIDNHGFTLNLGLWNGRIRNLPGGPVTRNDGETDRGIISRGDLFKLAPVARDDESGIAALRLFWRTLAWGTGSAHRNTRGRIRSIEADPSAAGLLLRDAARKSVTDARSAFSLLRPSRNAIKHLGPNFFSKFLYFAASGALEHPCLIVDKRVLTTLFRETRLAVFLPRTTNYGASVYEQALTVMQLWAGELSSPERTVGADEVERWAFAAGRTRGAPRT